MKIVDIYKQPLQQRRQTYGTTEVRRLLIDGIEFSGYKTYTFYFEKTYTEEIERSLGGVINNLNSVPFFITPRLRINFSMMSIDDYRRLYSLILSKSEFTVQCYNVLTNKPITCKMYFEPDDFPTLYMVARKIQGDDSVERWHEITGVRDYVVTMNGTNASLDLISVIYHSNPQKDTGASDVVNGDPDISINTEIIMGGSTNIPKLTFDEKYTFIEWNTKPDGTGTSYVDGQPYKITQSSFDEESNSLVLYAQWKPMTTYTLNFSYGLSTPEISNGKERFSEQVQNGSVITLPTINANPQVTYDGKTYSENDSPYYNGGWYSSSIKASNDSNRLKSPYTYDKNTSSTIYCLHDTRSYILTYHTNSANISLDAINLKFGETIPLPKLYEIGRTFKGWFWKHSNDDNELEEQQFTKTTMPPYNVEIYAKWE